MTILGKNNVRCVVCQAEYDYNQDGVKKQCPNCRTVLPPLLISEDGYIKINWQEIRTLAIYAHRWVTNFKLYTKPNQDVLTALERLILRLNDYRPSTGVELIKPTTQQINKSNEIVSPYYGK